MKQTRLAARISAFERLLNPSILVDPKDKKTCWTWRGSKCNKGYGCIRVAGKTKRCHIFAWETAAGRRVRRGFTLDHGCRNKACWRPSHMEEVTRAVNTARGNRANPRSTVKAREAAKQRRIEKLPLDPAHHDQCSAQPRNRNLSGHLPACNCGTSIVEAINKSGLLDLSNTLTPAMKRAILGIKAHGTTSFAGARWQTRHLLMQRGYILYRGPGGEHEYHLTEKGQTAWERIQS